MRARANSRSVPPLEPYSLLALMYSRFVSLPLLLVACSCFNITGLTAGEEGVRHSCSVEFGGQPGHWFSLHKGTSPSTRVIITYS